MTTTGGRAWVFAGGEFSTDHVPFDEVRAGDQFICVDRGIEHCLAAGLMPTLLIGDFDSASEEVLAQESLSAVPRSVYPAKKAASDLELALQVLADDPPESVVILGVSGGRTDHMLFNWMLPALRAWPFTLMLIDGTTQCHVLQGSASCVISVRPGQTISLLAPTGSTGVTTSGLQYPLQDATLEVGSTLGLSNVTEDKQVCVRQGSGTLLVLVNKIA
ncbi:thiamine diphosphokinase [Granulosicoccus antarcticus]|uniref:Thiamine diphosphokinase n=1 Tax=Granulosicoccus antarcticus IMCC3135 TaxID=1192854 RepID=A0A2Z2P2F2_9GAMM|nr:thiamine diphosphokinase [Granulosicoccus antarcticus]ASJ76488.1 Thiamine pyrophosphokinase [Granulosicoccus antarcticus IMCC3135]